MAILTVFENVNFGGRAAAFNSLTELPQSFNLFGISSFKKEMAGWLVFHADNGDTLAVFGPRDLARLDMQRPDDSLLGILTGATRDWNDCIVQITAPGAAPANATTMIGAIQGRF